MKYPYYLRGKYHYYKVLAPNTFIEIYRGYDECRVQQVTYITLEPAFNEEPFTESEFLDVYNEVRNKLEELATK